MPKRTGISKPRRLRQLDRAVKAMQMRLDHKSWEVIAKELGYDNPSGPYKAVMRYMEMFPAENVDEFRKIETKRMDFFREKVLESIKSEKFLDLDRVESYLKITDRVYRLMGVNNTNKNETNVTISLEALVDGSMKEEESDNRISELIDE